MFLLTLFRSWKSTPCYLVGSSYISNGRRGHLLFLIEGRGFTNRGFAKCGFRRQINKITGITGSKSAAFILPNRKGFGAARFFSLVSVIHGIALLVGVRFLPASRYEQKSSLGNAATDQIASDRAKAGWGKCNVPNIRFARSILGANGDVARAQVFRRKKGLALLSRACCFISFLVYIKR